MTSRFDLNSAEDALRVLGRLTDADRRWILERLPPAAKSRLSSGARTPAAESQPSAQLQSSVIGRLEFAPISRLLEVLLGEPDWVVHAVLSAHDWTWKKEALQRLPASLRLDVLRLKRCGVTLACPATDFLLRMLADEIGGSTESPPAPTSFESILRRFSRRATR